MSTEPQDDPEPDLKADRDTLPFLMLLPNLVTILGLCAGLTAIRFAFAGDFRPAAVLIVFAALIDGFDGMLARRLKATSAFGSELDSLSDFLSFGVAPGILVYQFAMGGSPDFGWVFVLGYVSCCCLRLARFNVAKNAIPVPGLIPSRHFVGVPAPGGALLALLPIYLSFEGHIDATAYPEASALYLGMVGILMVSRLPTFSPKWFRIPRDRAILLVIGSAMLIGVILTRFWQSMIVIDLVYLAMLARSLYQSIRNRRAKPAAKTPDS